MRETLEEIQEQPVPADSHPQRCEKEFAEVQRDYHPHRGRLQVNPARDRYYAPEAVDIGHAHGVPSRCEYRNKYYWENKERLKESRAGKYNQVMNERTEFVTKTIVGDNRSNQEPFVCKFLSKHYEDMKDDPERLSTDFIKKIMETKKDCGVPDES